MLFSGVLFLFVFFPAFLAVYVVLPKRLRNAFLFLSSLIFYAWGEPIYVFLMLFSIVSGWVAGLWLGHFRADKGKARLVLTLCVAIHIGILCFFKYGNFFIENLSGISGVTFSRMQLPLPLGVSFYTFQILSYIVDVYREIVPPQRNLIHFGAYVAMFPQLVAGPIVRYYSIAEQLARRQMSMDAFGGGAGLFVVGLAKKVLLANNIGILWDHIQHMPSHTMTVLAAWAGICAFGLQLYFDFSGYSDMALGLGQMLGFRFDKNFDYPYISRSITEFWRRWHISLGVWFREYLYFPLGGSRRGDGRAILNLFVVWAATGFWHGANWNFILWGLYYFLFLVGEKYIWKNLLDQTSAWLQVFYVLVVVMVGWSLFVFEDMGKLGLFIQALGGSAGGGMVNRQILYLLRSNASLLVVAATGATPLAAGILRKVEEKSFAFAAWVKSALLVAGFLLSVVYLVDSSYNPFLYFRF